MEKRSGCAAINSTAIALLMIAACDGVGPPPSPSRTIASAGSEAGAPATAATTIAPSQSVTARLGGTEHHDYRVTLTAGQLLRWSVQQHGLNLSIAALAPDGTTLVDEDYDGEPDGREAQLLVAASDGVFTLRIKGETSDRRSGSYDLVLAPASTPTDAERALAEALLVDARNKSLHLFGMVGGSRADLQAAVATNQDLAQRFGALGERRRRAHALVCAGNAYQALGELDNARVTYRRAQDEYGDYRPGIADVMLGRAINDYYRGDLIEAFQLDEQALVSARAIHDLWHEAAALHNLGLFHMALDEPQETLDLYQQALAIWEELRDSRNQTTDLSSIGDEYSNLGDAQSALDAYARALTAGGDGISDDARAYIEEGEGLVYLHLVDQGEVALEHFRKALALREHMADEAARVDSLAEVAEAYEALGQHAPALESGRRALERARQMHYQLVEADILALLGTSELGAGQVDKARATLDEAVELAQKNRSLQQEARAHGGLARLWRRRGELQRARQEIERAIALAESARAHVEAATLRADVFSRYSDYYDFYVDLLLHDERHAADVAKAFTMHERSRARTLLELLTATRTQLDREVAPALVAARDEAQRLVKAREVQYRQLLDRHSSGVELHKAERALATAMSAHQAAQARVRARAPRNAAFSDGNATVAELQALLPADGVLLEYALGDDRSYLWWLTAHSLDVTTLPPRAQIEAAARRYYELVTARSHVAGDVSPEVARARLADADRAAGEAAHGLARLLLSPVANRLVGQRLIIVPDGALEYVPFAALPVSSERTLLEDHQLSSLPSASVLPVLARRAPSGLRAAPRVAVFADPVFDARDPRVTGGSAAAPLPLLALRSASDVGLSGFRRLRFSRAEAEAVAALAKERSRIALDFAASRAALSDLRDFDIVHFATHGILNSRHAELSGLVLSLVNPRGEPVDGFLRLHDIYELDLNAELVVLSACESALGKEIRGEGLVGLTHGFLYAGAERVLASLWPIDDKSTAELFATFYTKLLREGARPSAALRAAQLMLAHSSSRSAPFYWAPFVLQGEVD